MPTIEIASINSAGLSLSQSDFEVAVIEENKLESHRGLFYNLLKRQEGVIVHVGNPDFKSYKESGFFAGAIIDWSIEPCGIIIPEVDENDLIYNNGKNQQFRFKFLDQFKPDIDKLLKIALAGSPIKEVLFLTDYQFGPGDGRIEIIYTITDFWAQHDKEGLDLNTLYEIYGQ
jgi:hypothetical protein